MAVKKALFVFEVVVDSVKSFVESRYLVIRSDFANIFSLELKDPKQMYIAMPEPLPPPPEPVGKKGKKKKPKPKKPKKGKKGKVVQEVPPPEPLIQSGQSVMFTSSVEVLIENMKKYPMEVSLWSKEDNLVFIGASIVPWDPVFLLYLENILKCRNPPSPIVKDEYNVFQEGTAKLMARLGIQVKLSYLTERVTTCFRTLSEDPVIKKVLYTGMNDRNASFICNYKTTDEIYEENSNKIENTFVVDDGKTARPITYADYKNLPGANIAFFKDGEYCCMASADKPPDSKYKAPETCPDINFIIDYVRKIIVSCNDNMRMLTPRPTIKPRIKATDIDRLCFCRETRWPHGDLAERFKNEALSGPCPICINAKPPGATRENTLDIANIRGPCGRPDCKIARHLRAYIEKLVAEENIIFDIEGVIGPCGSKSCSLATTIKQFLRKEGIFEVGTTVEGLTTQCACLDQMQKALMEKKESNTSVCSKDCESASSSDDGSGTCGGKACPFTKKPEQNFNVYNVYYFTVEYEFEDLNTGKPSRDGTPKSGTPKSGTPRSGTPSRGSSPSRATPSQGSVSQSSTSAPTTASDKYKYCSTDCAFKRDESENACMKGFCFTPSGEKVKPFSTKDDISPCIKSECPIPCTEAAENRKRERISPADSNIVISLKDIRNPCCVKSCDIAERVKDFIDDGVAKREKMEEKEKVDSCYCDCECKFTFNNKTTYCGVCGGYECLGDDVRQQPDYIKPHPCPVYHKLYDKNAIKVKSPWPDEQVPSGAVGGPTSKQTQPIDSQSMKSSNKTVPSHKASPPRVPQKGVPDQKAVKQGEGDAKQKKAKVKKPPKLTVTALPEKKVPLEKRYVINPVPKYMGWLWNADDVPGLKFRPKWQPGAANKILVRRYRTVREGVDNIAKKKRALLSKKKKIEMKPTLVVKKEDGEYTVQMEVFKNYSKERLLFQYPYDEKPPLVYTIGKTEEERAKIQKQRERRERRETRRKNRLLQSSFRDKCQEICLKAYNQAIGLKPMPNPNFPECPCVEEVKPETPPIDSCSCSESVSVSSSDTDNDEWIIEFTPPLARWDTKAKHPPTMQDNESQYTYIDYKVKLLDKQGNPIPRYFKGPDGAQVCSDLGGFWSPDKQWLEINKDGYIGPDGRWVPMSFTGPDGMYYTAEEGFFTDNQGRTLRIGIDGYIDKDGKWVWYSSKSNKGKANSTITATTDTKKGNSPKIPSLKPTIKQTSKPTTKDSKAGKTSGKATPWPMPPAKGGGDKGGKGLEKAKPRSSTAYTTGAGVGTTNTKGKSALIMNMSLGTNSPRVAPYNERSRLNETRRSNNMTPAEMKKMIKYKEIMLSLKDYDDLCEIQDSGSRLPTKTSRASNTPRKKISPFTMDCFRHSHFHRSSSIWNRASPPPPFKCSSPHIICKYNNFNECGSSKNCSKTQSMCD